MYKKGLAYKKESSQWWCPFDKTVLANEQVESGKCWRCGNEVEKKRMSQWFFAITKYADELLADIDDLDWPEKIKTMQRNWIGKSIGAEIDFPVCHSVSPLRHSGLDPESRQTAAWIPDQVRDDRAGFAQDDAKGAIDDITVFTTRPDTIFGATFMVLAPEHPSVVKITTDEKKAEVQRYVEQSAKKSEIERQENKDKTGVFTGAYAINPATNQKIPIWVADYVLMGYGTGAIMAVPAHDERDNQFAKKFDLPIINVINPNTTRQDAAEIPEQDFIKKRKIVALVTNDAGEILSINWGDKGGRLTIGGTVEGDESPTETALREVAEETGYDDLEVVATGDETYYYKYYAFSKNQAHDAETRFVHLKLKSDHRSAQNLDESEKIIKVEWVSQAQADKEITEPLHRYAIDKFIYGKVWTGEGVMTNSDVVNWQTKKDAMADLKSDLERGLIKEFGQPKPNEVDVFGAVIVGYNPKTNKYLGMRTNKSHVNVRLPGGSINDDETFEDCARRELKEETGYEPKQIFQLGAPILSHYYNSIKDSNRQSFAPHYIAIIEDEPGQAAREAHEADFTNEWFDFDDIYKEISAWGPDTEHWLYILEQAKSFVDNGFKLPESLRVSFNGLSSSEAREKIVKWLKSKGAGREKVNYKMRDWLISRQRYWGCPIPIAYDKDGQTHLIPDDQLPVELPRIDDYKPDDSGHSALAKEKDWLKVTIDGQEMTRETDTLDGFACSSWYLLRYADPHNTKQAWGKDLVDYWDPLDCYVGADHAVGHLMYVRFWCKFFNDLGLLSFREPVKRLLYNGYINDEKNKKMSKSKGNVVNPLDIINSGYGADTLRTYEMFIAPYEMDAPWSTAGVGGVYRFLTRVWNLAQELNANDLHLENPSDELLRWQHKTIKKVTEDIERTSFNTAVAALMEYLNYMTKNGASKSAVIDLAKLLMPFAPHIASELLEQLGENPNADWPKWDEKYLVADEAAIAIQVNGRLRGEITMPIDSNEDEARTAALEIENVKNFTDGKKIVKIIYVKNKIINFVVR
jgi:leucyl-tRNA synthetase